MTKKYIVNIDVTPEVEDYQHNEYDTKTKEDLIKHRLDGKQMWQVANIAAAARILGELEKDILPEDKHLYFQGIQVKLHQLETSQKRMAKMPSGVELEVREYIAPVPDQILDDTQRNNVNSSNLESSQVRDDTQEKSATLLPTSDPAALKRAEDYLLNTVTGYVEGRLVIIGEHSGDVRGVAEKFIQRVWEIVKMIEKPLEK